MSERKIGGAILNLEGMSIASLDRWQEVLRQAIKQTEFDLDVVSEEISFRYSTSENNAAMLGELPEGFRGRA